MRLEPIPTQTTPASNQPLSDASVLSTPPVGMIDTQGHGPLTAFTKPGPPTSLPGKILRISQPSSSAWEISEALPQPGEYGTLRRLQVRATSGFSTGPTTKLAPQLIYKDAVPGSTMEPAPRIISGSSRAQYFSNSLKTSQAWSPRLVNSSSRQPPARQAAATSRATSNFGW